MKVESRILKTEPIEWQSLQFIQQDDFKDWEPAAKHALKSSVVNNDFVAPFNVWEDESGVLWCMDGRHRFLILKELINEGADVPYSLPGNFIRCKDKKEAAKLVLLYSSSYAKITQKGLSDFLSIYDFDFRDISEEIDLASFNMDKFIQKNDPFGLMEDYDTGEGDDQEKQENGEESPAAESDELVVYEKESPAKHGDVYRLGRHRLFCGSFDDPELVKLLFAGEKARIMATDPPYNIKIHVFSKTQKEHEEFAMGSGEMSDTEFVIFIAKTMQIGRDNSVDGAIHYIFMDWRHCWHMAEAGAKVYDNGYEPKQLVVWKKNTPGNGSFYRTQHELCFIYKSGEAKHLSHLTLAARYRGNVWEYPSAAMSGTEEKELLKEHPTPKNVMMIADIMLDTSNPSEIVYDPFMGTGTTIIAADRTGRRGYGSEISPDYIRTIINRWANEMIKNGKPLDFEHVNGNLTLSDFEK